MLAAYLLFLMQADNATSEFSTASSGIGRPTIPRGGGGDFAGIVSTTFSAPSCPCTADVFYDAQTLLRVVIANLPHVAHLWHFAHCFIKIIHPRTHTLIHTHTHTHTHTHMNRFMKVYIHVPTHSYTYTKTNMNFQTGPSLGGRTSSYGGRDVGAQGMWNTGKESPDELLRKKGYA
jgi:hypothetical protein